MTINEEIINNMIQRHENFKQKGLMLTNDDLFDWMCLQDEMITISSNLKSEYAENKIRMDAEKWQRMIELKLELDENWKKVYTDATATSKIDNEYMDEDIEQAVRKTQYELLYSKAQTITEFINIVKLNNKALFTI